MIKKLFSFLTVLIALWSCKAEKITVPAYVQIDDYYTKVINTQGTNNQKFTDMLVYGNGQSSGTFPIGKPIPVLSSGPTNFLIRGVIEVNGVSSVRADYELMQGCDTLITVTPGKTTVIRPVFEYYSTVVPKWIENFNNPADSGSSPGGTLTPRTLDSTAQLDNNGFLGSRCLIMKPNANNTTIYVDRNQPLTLPSGGVGVYMELNYQSNINLNVNITGVGSGTGGGTTLGVGGVYPSAGWNKVYLDLTEQVSSLQDPNGYTITFYASYDASVGPNFVRLDNIKVLSKQ